VAGRAHRGRGRSSDATASRRLLQSFGRVRELGVTTRRTEINGQPGTMFFDRSGRLISVLTIDLADGYVQTVRSVVNPDKLRHLGAPADLRALIRELAERCT
jgi:RNA polymerase sigma-70 factor, ECF subfamily